MTTLGASAAFPLGAAWAVLAVVPVVTRARRVVPVARARELGRTRRRSHRESHGGSREGSGRHEWARSLHERAAHLRARARTTMVARVLEAPRRRRRAAREDAALAEELPVAVDLLGVAVGAGCTPYLAVESAVHWAPPEVSRELAAVVQACRLGATLATSLQELATRRPLFAPVTEALLVSERSGAPVAPALARLADEERAALRRRAEAHARRVPVRLLFPLAFLVLPAFVVLTVVPGLAAGMARL
jgi:hypothetical protein